MPYCLCGNITIYYEVHGEGPPLLLISGLGGGTWSWYGQVPYFEEGYRTIIFDNRGAGKSDMPEGPYRMEEFARDALCVLDRLEVERAFVVGVSMGGMIAQELALTAPERIRALVLGCTHCGGEISISPSSEVMRTLMSNEGLSHEEIVKKNLPIFFSAEFLETQPEKIAEYCRVQEETPRQPDAAYRAQLAAIRGFDASERLPGLLVPTLILTGSRDVVIPRENSYLLAEMIPGSEIVTLPGAGHSIQVECVGDFNTIVDRFIRQVAAEDEAEEIP
mgnify:CR=1 FL=1